MIGERLPATACLAGASILLFSIVAIPLGIYAASKPNSREITFLAVFHFNDGNPQLLCGSGLLSTCLPLCLRFFRRGNV